MTIEEQVPLGALTTFRIGGPARFFCEATTLDELREAFLFAKEKQLRLCILGSGSNMLVADEGFDGVVVRVGLRGIDEEESEEKKLLIAAAGEEWDSIVAHAVSQGIWGIENLSGIPGTVGAAPVQNIGAYGTEAKDTIVWVEALEVASGVLRRFERAECGFGYRTSMFKKQPGAFCITRVAFALTENGKPNLSYRDLSESFAGNPAPSLADIRSAVIAIRAKKFPDLSKEGTAGSFFLNPVVSEEVAKAITERFPDVPRFPSDGGIKLSLAWLLDHALNLRGAHIGNARTFERQPLVIVAGGNTSARDVVSLAEKISDAAKNELGITLELEVRYIS